MGAEDGGTSGASTSRALSILTILTSARLAFHSHTTERPRGMTQGLLLSTQYTAPTGFKQQCNGFCADITRCAAEGIKVLHGPEDPRSCCILVVILMRILWNPI